MGNLITEMPLSEVTATLEYLSKLGVTREDLKNFRSNRGKQAFYVASYLKYAGDLVHFGEDHNYVVNGNSKPFVHQDFPEYVIESHQKCGRFIWQSKKVIAEKAWDLRGRPRNYLSPVSLDKIRRYHLDNSRIVLNANVLWFLYEHEWLIPRDLVGGSILFAGTTFKNIVDNKVYILSLNYKPDPVTKRSWRIVPFAVDRKGYLLVEARGTRVAFRK